MVMHKLSREITTYDTCSDYIVMEESSGQTLDFQRKVACQVSIAAYLGVKDQLTHYQDSFLKNGLLVTLKSNVSRPFCCRVRYGLFL